MPQLLSGSYVLILASALSIGGVLAACDSDGEETGLRQPSSAATAVTTPATSPASPTPVAPSATATPSLSLCKYLPPGTTFAITPPVAGLPERLAALSGAWEGLWAENEAASSALIVREISGQRVEASYVFQTTASLMTFEVSPGEPPGLLVTTTGGGAVSWTWALSPDGNTLTGVRTQAGTNSVVAMKRCRLR